MTRDPLDIVVIACPNCCAREPAKQLQAMRTAMTASRSVEFSLKPHSTRWGWKEHDSGAGQSALSRFESNILATSEGVKALEDMPSRSADTFLRRRNKR